VESVSDPTRKEKLRGLLDAALELAPSERRAFLQEQSSVDPWLHREVEALLGPLEAAAAGPSGSETAATLTSDETSHHATIDAAHGQVRLRRWGHLEILEQVGQGHFGDVYLCRDPALDRVVALKLYRSQGAAGERVDPSVLRQIEHEGQLLARVEHPNVLKVYGVGSHEGMVGLWMEFVRGRTLAALLRSQGRYGAREASVIGAELCAALAAVHTQGVLHRDIKAQNVIREDGGRIILMDFGAGHDLIRPLRPEEVSTVGTPVYMAPEVLRGEPATVRSDVYSMGVLLFHLVTGDYPVRADTLAELRRKHQRGENGLLRDLRPDLPARFVRVVETALRPDPAERFASAGQMQRALEAAADLGVESTAAAIADGQDPDARALRRVVTVLTWMGRGAAALALLGFLGFVTSMTYRISLGIPADYFALSAQDYLVWGMRASIPGIYFAGLSLLAGLGLWWIGRLIAKAMRRVEIGISWRDRWSRARASFARAGATRLLMAVSGLGLAGLASAIILQRRLLSAIWSLHNVEAARLADLTVLQTDATRAHHLYLGTFAVLIVTILLLTSEALSLGATADGGRTARRWALAAVVAVVVMAASFLVLPWRLLWDNAREVALCRRPDGTERKAFVVASSTAKDECSYWLYFPDAHERAGIACEPTDQPPACHRTGRYEYVFGGSFER
jgi:Protein kinase domain